MDTQNIPVRTAFNADESIWYYQANFPHEKNGKHPDELRNRPVYEAERPGFKEKYHVDEEPKPSWHASQLSTPWICEVGPGKKLQDWNNKKYKGP
ncbi:hypothetical protein PspLS_09226 [Pyricularia sp. CBS 133598]|nr:hypothetical protein PspLS_09226 [Pyricularia sp. CBS 133598]